MSEKVIYKITNKINGKEYVGGTIDKQGRWEKHKWGLRNNCHNNPHLQNAWNKYGSDNFKFSVIEEVNKTSDLVQREQHYMDELKPEYNIVPKADRSETSEETRQRLSKVNSGKRNPFYGKQHSEEAKRKDSEAHKGKNNAFYGKHHSEETKKKISESNKGREVSQETREKLSEINKGKTASEEAKQKMSESTKGTKNPQSKLTEKKVKVILHLLDGNSFTHKEISKMYGVSGSTIDMIAMGDNWKHVKI